jgi:hypothetical protein
MSSEQTIEKTLLILLINLYLLSLKLCYVSLKSLDPTEIKWWWSKLWKVKSPPKSILFIWLILNNRVLTWEMLQNKNKIGPRKCSLCNVNRRLPLIFSCLVYSLCESERIWRLFWVLRIFGKKNCGYEFPRVVYKRRVESF